MSTTPHSLRNISDGSERNIVTELRKRQMESISSSKDG
jgi:hypothetical protein